MRHDWPLVLVISGALGLAGCSHDPTQPAGPPTDYRGVIAGSEGVGTIEVLIARPPAHADAGTVPVRATLRLYSGFYVSNLEGTFDASRGSLALSGSSWTLQGTIANGLLRGDGATSSGSSVFIAQEQGTGADAVSDYTGVVDYQAGLAIRGGIVVGATQVPGLPIRMVTFTGSFSTADSSLTLLDPANPSGPAIGTGSLYAYPHVTVATVQFDFGSGRIARWTGYPWIGYSGP